MQPIRRLRAGLAGSMAARRFLLPGTPAPPGPVPTEMRAAVWRGDPDPLKMRVETLRTPTPKKGEFLVKVRACGVCHTDLHCMKGEVPFPKPAVFGHEISGSIVACGEGTRLPVGTKVVCPFIMPCGSCHFCTSGEEDTCETFFALNRGKGQLYDGTTRLFDTAGDPVAMYSFAGLAEYAVVPATAVFPLSPYLGDNLWSESSVLGCAFFTAAGAILNAAQLQPGQTVCVIGCGGVGGGVIQLASHLGAAYIIGVDITDSALAQARAMGVNHTINAAKEDVLERIRTITGGRKVDVCFEVIGLKQTFEQAVMSVRDGGKACFVGIADVSAKAEVPITHMVRRRISLVGSYGGRASTDMPYLIRAASDEVIDLRSAITRRYSLDQAGEAYAALARREIAGRAIVEFGA